MIRPPTPLDRLARLLITLAIPLVLTMSVVRLVTRPWFPALEYRRPDFPADPLGMPTDERLRLARAAVRYLAWPRSAADLAALTLPDGRPAFNSRELRHMADVKRVYDALTDAALLALLLALIAARHLARTAPRALCTALALGGLLTLILLSSLGLWMLLGFDAFFVAFHRLFFEGNSWLFPATDTLIRLFPLPFWMHAGMLVAAIVVGLALILILLGKKACPALSGVARDRRTAPPSHPPGRGEPRPPSTP